MRSINAKKYEDSHYGADWGEFGSLRQGHQVRGLAWPRPQTETETTGVELVEGTITSEQDLTHAGRYRSRLSFGAAFQEAGFSP